MLGCYRLSWHGLAVHQIAHYSFEIDRVKMSQQTIDCQQLLQRSCTHCQYCNGHCSEPSCDYATMEHNTTGVRGQSLLITTRNSKQTLRDLSSSQIAVTAASIQKREAGMKCVERHITLIEITSFIQMESSQSIIVKHGKSYTAQHT